jgi:hypothetical protein
MLARLAHVIVRHRRAVIGAWVVATLFGVFAAGQVSTRSTAGRARDWRYEIPRAALCCHTSPSDASTSQADPIASSLSKRTRG